MNRSELAADVARQASLPKSAVDRVVGAVFTAIGDALARGERVTIAGFGTFTARQRSARRGRNPRTAESIAIAAATVPSFKAGKAIRDAVNG